MSWARSCGRTSSTTSRSRSARPAARVEAKIVFKDERVFLEKWCPEHGRERVLIADDVGLLPPLPRGLHQAAGDAAALQHASSAGAARTTAACAPTTSSTRACRSSRSPTTATCAARSATRESGPHRPASAIARARSSACSMRSSRNEGEPDVVQISGGEPTLHPDFFAILDAAKRAPDPAPDGQHQRHAHREGAGVRGAARAATCRTSRSTCSSIRSSATTLHRDLRGARPARRSARRRSSA